MTKVVCFLPNAIGSINGVEFIEHEDGEFSISKNDVEEPNLSLFLSIPGYEEFGKKAAAKAETPRQRAARLKAEQAQSAQAEPVDANTSADAVTEAAVQTKEA